MNFYTSMEPCHRRMVLFNFSINTNYLFLFKKKQVYTILCFLFIFFLIKIFSYTALFTENDNIRRITFLRLDAITMVI